jgi:cell division septal protein FtsQ
MSARRRPNHKVRLAALRSGLPIWLATVAAFVLTPLAAWTVLHEFVMSDAFIVRACEVEGNVEVTEEVILAAAGLDRPRNRLMLNEEVMEQAIAALPWISEVDVTIHRSGVVDIRVQESRLFAVATLGVPMLVDSQGRVIREMQPDDAVDAPYLVGFDQQGADGSRVLDPRAFGEAREVVELSSSLAGRLGRVREVHFSPSTGYRLVFETGVDVALGRDRFAERLVRADQTLRVLEERGTPPASLIVDGSQTLDRVTVRLAAAGQQDVAQTEESAVEGQP